MTLLHAIGDRLHRDNDQWARQHGWQVTARHGGMSRSYRDPRFDQLMDNPGRLSARETPDTEESA